MLNTTVTVEISLYPLKDDYTPLIIEFIKGLNIYKRITVHSTAMSTYISGEFDVIMNILTVELERIYDRCADCSTVIKIVPKPLNIGDGFLEF